MSIKESVEIFKGIDQQDEHFPRTIKELTLTLKLVIGLFLIALSLQSGWVQSFLRFGARSLPTTGQTDVSLQHQAQPAIPPQQLDQH